jgi:WhiB family redox-sensing transcriptional regulator
VIPETLEIISRNTPNWMADALCGNGDYDPEDWFPKAGEEYSAKVLRAKGVCKICPVKNQCLKWAYETRDTWGVLGGMTAKQRNRVINRIMRKRNEWKAQRDRTVRL